MRFTVRRISLQTQASLLSSRQAATITVADVAAIVVVADVADAETTSNCYSYDIKGWHLYHPFIFFTTFE